MLCWSAQGDLSCGVGLDSPDNINVIKIVVSYVYG